MDPIDPLASSQEVLSQTDVERLLMQVAEQEANATIFQSGGEKKSCPKDSVQPFDFRTPAFLSAGELRRLRIHHEDFIKALAARLSVYLRVEFALQMTRLQTVTYQKFVESLTNPTHLTLFKAEPLKGICLLDITPRLGLTVVDRLMGGPGHSNALNRDLSEIESALLDQIIQVVLAEWCNHWSGVQELRHSIIGHENTGQFVQSSQPDAVMLVLSMEARFGDCIEQMQLAFPYLTLEPIIRKLSIKLNPDPEERAANASAAKPQWKPELADMRIAVRAQAASFTVPARALAQLKIGDVLQLEAAFANKIQIHLSDLPKFVGRLGTRGDNWAIEITGILKQRP